MTARPRSLLPAAVLGPLLGLGGLAAGQTVVVLPFAVNTNITGISDDGMTVAGASALNGGQFYFWNRQSGTTLVNTPVAGSPDAPYLSGDGHTLLGESSPFLHSFIATDSGSVSVLPFSFPQATRSLPSGLNTNGTIAAGYDYNTSQTLRAAWRWTQAGGYESLPMIQVNCMSGDGSTVVGSDQASLALIWRNGTTSRLSAAPGSTRVSTEGFGTDSGGSMIVGRSSSDSAIWVNGLGTLLPRLSSGPYTNYHADELSDDGTVILGKASFDINTVETIWTPARGTELINAYFASYGIDLSAYSFYGGTVSPDGRSFGLTANETATNTVRAIYITIPTPATPAALAALLTLCPRRRRPQARRPALLLPVVL